MSTRATWCGRQAGRQVNRHAMVRQAGHLHWLGTSTGAFAACALPRHTDAAHGDAGATQTPAHTSAAAAWPHLVVAPNSQQVTSWGPAHAAHTQPRLVSTAWHSTTHRVDRVLIDVALVCNQQACSQQGLSVHRDLASAAEAAPSAHTAVSRMSLSTGEQHRYTRAHLTGQAKQDITTCAHLKTSAFWPSGRMMKTL